MSHLTQEQRYKIEALYKENFSQKAIADHIGKNKSIVCRELKRNCDERNKAYRANLAQQKCDKRHANKSKQIRFTIEIKTFVDEYLNKDYSPEQIVGYAKLNNLSCVSIERIYQYIWLDKKKGGSLYTHLRSQGKRYRKRGASKDKRGQIVGRTSIEHRPEEVDKKERIGDIELDLIIGKDHKGALLTANDRVTGIAMIKRIACKDAEIVKEAIIFLLSKFKPFLKTITSDNGKEFSRHKEIAQELDIGYYFARPYHSWERGANENMNGLIRQYFPKGMSFDKITDQDVQEVENKLNSRPRKRFGFKTPNQIFSEKLKELKAI